MFKEKKYFFITLYIAFSIFITDKIFLIPIIKKITVSFKKVEIFFYESREIIFENLKHENKISDNHHFYSLILGSSRSGMFSNDYIRKHLSNVKTYNFSAPLAGASYYFYWLDKIIKEVSKKPKIVFVEIDAINLGEPALRMSLPYSYDPIYMLQNFDFYRESEFNKFDIKGKGFLADEVDSYFIEYFFIMARYDIHPLKIFENFKKIDYFDPHTKEVKKIPRYEFAYIIQKKNIENMKTSLGGIPTEFYAPVNENNFKIDAQKYFKRIMPEPKLSSTQIIFLKKIFEITKQHNIPLILFNLPMSEPAEEILKNYQLFELNQLAEIINQYNHVLYIDSRTINCKKFIDSIHLSPICYPELTDYILSKIKEKNFFNK